MDRTEALAGVGVAATLVAMYAAAMLATRPLMTGGFPVVAQPEPIVVPVAHPSFPTLLEVPWASYEFIQAPDQQEFHDAVVDGSEVSTQDSGWTIDTPEDPDSVLAFLTYRKWIAAGTPNLDLTGRHVVIVARGEGLNLYGGHARFWLVTTNNRWHLTEPMEITGVDQLWHLDLAGESPSRFHRSWTSDGANDLAAAKAAVHSYGIAFVDFSQEPTGRLIVSAFHFT